MAVREKGLEIDVLEKRISCLERRILTSEKDVRSLEGSSCLGTLNNIQKSLDKISSRYARIAALWKKMTDLETFLAPEFLEKASLTDDAKVDIIIAGEDQVRSCAEQLKQVEDLKKVVATEPLKDLPTWSAKLQPLVELHIQQKGELSAANEKLHNLLAAYNNITCHPITKDCVMSLSAEEAVGYSPASAINLLSRQFVQWDNTLTQMEQSMEVKPAD